ncbi:MAG: hypothetical protein NC395_09850 [Prevotella sp.]|nr:hypothetical protein [Prevotella sp.]
MASKREELFKINHYRYKKLQRHFKISFWAGLIPSAGVFAVIAVINFIRTLAMLAGAGAIVAQIILNAAFDTNDTSGLVFKVPYAYMTYLFLIAAITAAAFVFKARKPHTVLFVIYAAGALFGLIGMFTGAVGTLFGMYLLVYGCYGMWLEDFTRRLYKELDYLSLQDGYPDFIEAINEPKAMANSLGLRYHQSEYQKRIRKEAKALKEAKSAEAAKNGGDTENLLSPAETSPPAEMEELSLDAPPPKSSRKIDSML